MSGRDALSAFLWEQAATPLVPGVNDCGLMIADWFKAVRGFDPCPELRGLINSNAVLEQHGGFYGIARKVRMVCTRHGLQRVREWQRGDIGIIALGNIAGFAICTGKGWAMKSENGIRMLNRPAVIRAWRL